MKRTYLGLMGMLVLAGSSLAAAFPLFAGAAAIFDTQPLDRARFAVLARPVGASDWNLVVLEQLVPKPDCWEARADGLVDPALTRFDFTDICARYIDSNGYSLRINQEDLATSYRLQLRRVGDELQLQAASGEQPTVLVVGRAAIPKRDRDGFVALQLESGWELLRRSYGEKALQHIYFANTTALGQLLAEAGGAGAAAEGEHDPLAQPASSPQSSALHSEDTAPESPFSSMPERRRGRGSSIAMASTSGRPIPLQVIPFQE